MTHTYDYKGLTGLIYTTHLFKFSLKITAHTSNYYLIYLLDLDSSKLSMLNLVKSARLKFSFFMFFLRNDLSMAETEIFITYCLNILKLFI